MIIPVCGYHLAIIFYLEYINFVIYLVFYKINANCFV